MSPAVAVLLRPEAAVGAVRARLTAAGDLFAAEAGIAVGPTHGHLRVLVAHGPARRPPRTRGTPAPTVEVAA